MATTTIRPNELLDADSGWSQEAATIYEYLADENTGTIINNTATNQAMDLGFENLPDGCIETITGIQVFIGVYAGGKGAVSFRTDLYIGGSGSSIQTILSSTSSTSASNEEALTALTGLSYNTDQIDGMHLIITTTDETQCLFTDIKIVITWSRCPEGSTNGTISHNSGKISLTSGKVSF